MVAAVLPAERDRRAALRVIEALAAPFDPTQSRHTWRVAATDYAESAILLPILASLRRQAPGSRLAVQELAPPRIVRQAERGDTLRSSPRFDAPSRFAQASGLRSTTRKSLA
ncbi:hypothetical protein FA454_00755 [Pseudomonas aeruginosa]|nr:hypothetical protein [Pseudomonas aeruginosa]MCO1778090.1 hypothetical protein [Pseudomonas aeruginosa]MCO1794495.1 hypothetical protein [Pseudomonas aeruginosa]MCO1796521.1 hypothetical protein [Pseudomonas aeruginosa]MCO4017186.1 hypothetical protein [Pseudomonas aeruginosa]